MQKNKKSYNNPTYWGMEATTTNKDWGFIPVPGKGGNTTNAEIPEWMFKRELEEMEGGVVNA
jgi:hypothetical protein